MVVAWVMAPTEPIDNSHEQIRSGGLRSANLLVRQSSRESVSLVRTQAWRGGRYC